MKRLISFQELTESNMKHFDYVYDYVEVIYSIDSVQFKELCKFPNLIDISIINNNLTKEIIVEIGKCCTKLKKIVGFMSLGVTQITLQFILDTFANIENVNISDILIDCTENKINNKLQVLGCIDNTDDTNLTSFNDFLNLSKLFPNLTKLCMNNWFSNELTNKYKFIENKINSLFINVNELQISELKINLNYKHLLYFKNLKIFIFSKVSKDNNFDNNILNYMPHLEYIMLFNRMTEQQTETLIEKLKESCYNLKEINILKGIYNYNALLNIYNLNWKLNEYYNRIIINDALTIELLYKFYIQTINYNGFNGFSLLIIINDKLLLELLCNQLSKLPLKRIKLFVKNSTLNYSNEELIQLNQLYQNIHVSFD